MTTFTISHIFYLPQPYPVRTTCSWYGDRRESARYGGWKESRRPGYARYPLLSPPYHTSHPSSHTCLPPSHTSHPPIKPTDAFPFSPILTPLTHPLTILSFTHTTHRRRVNLRHTTRHRHVPQKIRSTLICGWNK